MASGSAAGGDPAKLALLAACLRFDAEANEDLGLGAAIAAFGWDGFLVYADRLGLGPAVVRATGRRGLAPPLPALTLPDGRVTITEGLRQREALHKERCATLANRLAEIVDALKRQGITPVALKGGASIVTGAPDWRSLRDLDLLVPIGRADEAQTIVQRLGYLPGPPSERRAHHHLPELYRDDMPGWIEIHHRASQPRAEQFLPTAELLAAALLPPNTKVPGIAVLPPHLHALHGLLHHHIGHRAVKEARIDIKGLYEFGAAIEDMLPAEREMLWERSSRHPRVLAILELWLAAAADLFGRTVPSPVPGADVLERWRRLRNGTEPTGIGPELRTALDPHRLRRVQGGRHALRRAWWRLTVPLSLLNRPTLAPDWIPWGWGAPREPGR